MMWLVLLVGLLAQDKTPEAVDALQGDWVVVSAIRGGKPLPAEQAKMLSVTFKGDIMTLKDATMTDKVKFELDPKQKTPWINFVNDEETAPGIYELKGDDLKICWAMPDRDRPTDFAAQAETKATCLILKRKK